MIDMAALDFTPDIVLAMTIVAVIAFVLGVVMASRINGEDDER
jgi:hypothetical protein